MERSNRLVKNTLILGIGTIFSKCLVLIMVPIYSRWLSAENYGTFDLLTTYITLLIPFITLSCGEAVFRFTVDTDKIYEQKKVISNGFGVVLIGLVISLCGIFIFSVIQLKDLFISFYVYLVGSIFNYYFLTYLRGIRRLKIYAISNVLYMILAAVFVTIFVYFLRFDLKGIMYGNAVAYFCTNIYIVITTKFYKYISFKVFDFPKLKEMIKYSLPLIPNSISWWIVNVSDRTVINIFLGATFNGIYAIAYKIPSIATTLFSVFHISWQESASDAMNDRDKEAYFNQVLNNIIPILITICICVLSINFVLFDYVFDPKYATAYYQVPILIAAVIFTSVSQFFGGIFIGMKETGKNGSTTVIAAIINIIVHVAFVKVIGLYAASISTLVSFISLCVIRYFMINKIYKLRFTNKSLILFLLFVYFFSMQYLNIAVVNYINIILAISIFFIVNWTNVIRYINKILKNKEKLSNNGKKHRLSNVSD